MAEKSSTGQPIAPRPPPPPSMTHERRLKMDYNTYFNTSSTRPSVAAFPTMSSPMAPKPPLQPISTTPPAPPAPPAPPTPKNQIANNPFVTASRAPLPSNPPPAPQQKPPIPSPTPGTLAPPPPPPPPLQTPRNTSPSVHSNHNFPPPSSTAPRPSLLSSAPPPPPPSGPRQSVLSTASRFSTPNHHASNPSSSLYDKEGLRRPSQFSTNPRIRGIKQPNDPTQTSSTNQNPPSSPRNANPQAPSHPSSNPPTIKSNFNTNTGPSNGPATQHKTVAANNSFNSFRSINSAKTTSSNGTTIIHPADPLISPIPVNKTPQSRNQVPQFLTSTTNPLKTPIKSHTNQPSTLPPNTTEDGQGEVIVNGSYIFFSPKLSIVSRRDTAALQNILKEAAGTPSHSVVRPLVIEEFETGYDDEFSSTSPSPSPTSQSGRPHLWSSNLPHPNQQHSHATPLPAPKNLPLPAPPVPTRPQSLKPHETGQSTPTLSFGAFVEPNQSFNSLNDIPPSQHNSSSKQSNSTDQNPQMISLEEFHSRFSTPLTPPAQPTPSTPHAAPAPNVPPQFPTLMRLQSLHLKSSDISLHNSPAYSPSPVASTPEFGTQFGTQSRSNKPPFPPPSPSASQGPVSMQPAPFTPIKSTPQLDQPSSNPPITDSAPLSPRALQQQNPTQFSSQTSLFSHQRLLSSPSTLAALNQREYQQAIEEYNEQLQKEAYEENDFGHYHGMDIKKNALIDEKVQKLWRLSYAESRRIQNENWEYFEEQCFQTGIPIYIALRNTKPGQLLVRDGVPIRQRAPIWAQLLQIDAAKRAFPTFYPDCVSQITIQPTKSSKDIAKDVRRTMQYHELFQSNDGLEMLSNILSVFSFKYPKIGYCQSMNVLASTLLLFYTEQDSYYMLEALLTSSGIIPSCYYTDNLIDVKTDVQVLVHYIRKRFPAVYKKVTQTFDLDLCTIFIPWFMCLFVEILPLETAMRIWDIMLTEGHHTILFRVGLFIVWLLSNDIVGDDTYNTTHATISKSQTTNPPKTSVQQHTCNSPGDVLMLFSQTPSQLIDVDSFIHFIHQPNVNCYLTKAQIDKNRRRYRKQIERDFLKSLKYVQQQPQSTSINPLASFFSQGTGK